MSFKSHCIFWAFVVISDALKCGPRKEKKTVRVTVAIKLSEKFNFLIINSLKKF